MATQITTSIIIILFLSFQYVRTDIKENVMRNFQFNSYKRIDYEKPAPTSTEIYFKGNIYLKSIENRSYAFSAGFYNYSFGVSGDYAEVPDLLKCKGFSEINNALKEPIVTVYDANGVHQHIEVNKNIDSELSQVIKLHILSLIQVDAVKLQEEEECGNTTINTKETLFGNDREVDYNVNCEELGNATRSYWIQKDFKRIPGNLKNILDMDREDTKNICIVDATRNYRAIEDGAVQFKSDTNEESIQNVQDNILKNYKPLINERLRLFTKSQIKIARTYSDTESSHPDTEIDKPLIVNKFTLERPSEAIIAEANTSTKLDNIPLEYLLLCADFGVVMDLTVLQYAMNC